MEVDYQFVKNIWDKINIVLLKEYQDIELNGGFLLEGATEEKICGMERELNIILPYEYRVSLKIHEGTAPYVWLWDAVSISDIATVIDDWKTHIRMASSSRNIGFRLNSNGPILNVLFDKKWIPVASDNGIPICLDMNPLLEGNKGQIIYVDWEEGTVKVISNNFIDFLENGLCKMDELAK